MTSEQVKEVVKYWQKTAEHDYETMLWLFKGKRYSDALFFGHIVLEKVLKGLVVERIKQEAPYIHNLTKLAELSGIYLTEDEWQILDLVNQFNIRCRYPDYKLRFYKHYNQFKIAKEKLDQIEKLFLKLCTELKLKLKQKI